MLARSVHLLLGIALLMQSGPVCVCAIEHYLTCGHADDLTFPSFDRAMQTADTEDDRGPHCFTGVSRPVHPHRVGCEVKDTSDQRTNVPPSFCPAPIERCAVDEIMAIVDPIVAHCNRADLAVRAAPIHHSLPLLI